jgi:hypothetical protein
MVDNIQGAAFQTLHLLLALDAGEITRVGRALAMEGGILATTGARDRSARLLQEAERLVDRPDCRAALGLCRTSRLVAALHHGQFEEADRLAREAEAILTEQQGLSAWPLNIARVYHISVLANQGKIAELCRVNRLWLDDVVDRGNRFTATMLRTGWSTLRWLGDDDLPGARAALAEALEQCPEGVFYVPHLYCVLAQGFVGLYGGEAEEAYRRITQVWPMIEWSQLLRMHALTVLACRMRAACAIAAAQGAADPKPLLALAERDARRMERTRYSAIWTRDWPQMIRAEVALARGNRARALAHVDRAMDGFRERGAAFFLAIAGRKKGELLGGDEGRALIAAADAWMASEGIVNPARLAAAFVPGFPSGGLP